MGNNLAWYFREEYDVSGWYCSHEVSIDGVALNRVNISFEDSLKSLIEDYAPDIIIHCASLTDVDFCERHKELTELVNTIDTQRFVQACKNPEIKFVYISTDSVYDGTKGNYKETDPVNPCNYYGLSKYKGEQAVLEKEKSLILRTNIFGWNIQDKQSLAEWILYNLLNGKSIQGFKNAYFSSIYTFDLARVLGNMLEKDLEGVYNCASMTSQSKYEFACSIAELFGLDKNLIKPIDIKSSGLFAKRGENLTLNVEKLCRETESAPPEIKKSLNHFYRHYIEGLPAKIKFQAKKDKWYPQKLPHIPYGRQSLDEEDISAVVEVLKSEGLTQASCVTEFENALSGYTGAKFAVVFNSGTSALHSACLAAGVGGLNEVITSPNTFVASANCAVYCGARPIFADIDEKTYNISPIEIEKKITLRTKTVIPVHFAGQSCDMTVIRDIIRKKEKRYGEKIYLIEDACHALGSSYKGHKCGDCFYSDMAVMSFHPVKHITTGEGGVVLTNDSVLYRKLKIFRSHGITNTAEELIHMDKAFNPQGIFNPGYYEQQFLGYNYRLTDIQCALGISQLKKLGFFIKRRREIADFYNNAFSGNKYISIPSDSLECETNWHLYVLNIDFEAMNTDRTEFVKRLKQNNIQTQVHYIPVHTQPFYMKNFGTNWGDCPKAEAYYKKCLSIPLFPLMTEPETKKVASAILAVAG